MAVVNGTSENDFFLGSFGNDTIYGRGGDDWIYGDWWEGKRKPVGAIGVDWVSGGKGDDTLITWDGSDTIYGGPGNDDLYAFGGPAVVKGGSGNDTLMWMADGLEFNGGSGIDVLWTADHDLDLKAVGATIKNIEVINMSGDLQGHAGTADTLTVNEADLLHLSSTSNTLRVFGTRDTVDIEGQFLDKGIQDGFHKYRLGKATLLVDTDTTVI